MLDRNFLQSFLRVNNASEAMSNEDIAKILLRAGWLQTETDAAIALLRSNTNESMYSDKRKATGFRPDMDFSSAQISTLLGIDVVIDPNKLSTHPRAPGQTARVALLHFAFVASVIVLAVGIALGTGIGSAYYFEIGPFDPVL